MSKERKTNFGWTMVLVLKHVVRVWDNQLDNLCILLDGSFDISQMFLEVGQQLAMVCRQLTEVFLWLQKSFHRMCSA